MAIIPPVNFGMVEDELYRSGEPNELNFPFMERLNLNKIIYLAPDEPSQKFLSFVHDQGIQFVHLGKEGTKTPWKPTSEDVVIAALDAMLDPSSYPLHIMCHLGRHRTGTVIGCLRKIQGWNLASIFAEYRRYAGSKVRLLNEQFIELFDTDLVAIPASPSSVIYDRDDTRQKERDRDKKAIQSQIQSQDPPRPRPRPRPRTQPSDDLPTFTPHTRMSSINLSGTTSGTTTPATSATPSAATANASTSLFEGKNRNDINTPIATRTQDIKPT